MLATGRAADFETVTAAVLGDGAICRHGREVQGGVRHLAPRWVTVGNSGRIGHVVVKGGIGLKAEGAGRGGGQDSGQRKLEREHGVERWLAVETGLEMLFSEKEGTAAQLQDEASGLELGSLSN